ncbi:hypothetical protein [Novosphingobium sp.]|uniref:hypothetical protein n=1 Tax=Novosphingobium sp. TaxID=1874826 RepID=UPI0028ADEA3F|nr:hypothetical protein [Novosphingobium sp.]
MTISKRGRKFSGVAAVSIVAPMVVLVAILIAVWAWMDGGRSPVKDIVQPVAVPESPE